MCFLATPLPFSIFHKYSLFFTKAKLHTGNHTLAFDIASLFTND